MLIHVTAISEEKFQKKLNEAQEEVIKKNLKIISISHAMVAWTSSYVRYSCVIHTEEDYHSLED